MLQLLRLEGASRWSSREPARATCSCACENCYTLEGALKWSSREPTRAKYNSDVQIMIFRDPFRVNELFLTNSRRFLMNPFV